MTIDSINFNKLQPYDGKTSRSFELLIYHLVRSQYGHLGAFSPIAGSGGDGGIEFYLELTTGGTWGWQCKYFEGAGRLNQSGRARKIQDSLETAARSYPEMTKWTLCLKTNLTVGTTDKTGKAKQGERDWFRDALP